MAVLATNAWAQSPTYRPPPPPSKKSALELRMRYLIQPDISFSGLGTIPYRDNSGSAWNNYIGTERSVQYDDGSLNQDYLRTTIIAGGPMGQDTRPSTNKAATSNFVYFNEEQVADGGNAILFNNYRSAADPSVEFDGSGSGSLGWELNYTKYINRKRNFGLQVGFSFNGFDSRFNDQIDAKLYKTPFLHEFTQGSANDDGTLTGDPYVGREDWLADKRTELYAND